MAMLRFTDGPLENICKYAAQRIEDLEAETAELRTRFMAADKSCMEDRERIKELKSEIKAGAHLCAVRQDRINDIENLLLLARNTLVHLKARNDNPTLTIEISSHEREVIVSGGHKVLLDEAVSRIERFFEGKEDEKP